MQLAKSEPLSKRKTRALHHGCSMRVRFIHKNLHASSCCLETFIISKVAREMSLMANKRTDIKRPLCRRQPTYNNGSYVQNDQAMVKPKKNRNFFQFAPKPFGHAPKAAGGQVWGPKNTRDLYFHFSFAYTDANAFSSKAEKIVLIIETSSQVLLCMHPLSSSFCESIRG